MQVATRSLVALSGSRCCHRWTDLSLTQLGGSYSDWQSLRGVVVHCWMSGVDVELDGSWCGSVQHRVTIHPVLHMDVALSTASHGDINVSMCVHFTLSVDRMSCLCENIRLNLTQDSVFFNLLLGSNYYRLHSYASLFCCYNY